jgi:chromosome partitioning protein
MRTIAIINQKGGCGKTTTAINLSAMLARAGKRTLLVDLDSQSHCAAGLGIPESRVDLDIGDAMLAAGHKPIDVARLLWQPAANFDLAPSRMRLAGLEASRGGLANLPDKERRLEAAIDVIGANHDIVCIDCSPSIGLLTYNALVAADVILIPVETSFFSMQGATRQVNTVKSLSRKLGIHRQVWILPTIHDPSNPVAMDLLDELYRRFGERVIPAVIRRDAKLREAASFGQTIIDYAPGGTGFEDYARLADWVISHWTVSQDLDRALAAGPEDEAPMEEPADEYGQTDATEEEACDPEDAEEAMATMRPSSGMMPAGNSTIEAKPGMRAEEVARRAQDFVRRAVQVRADDRAMGRRPEPVRAAIRPEAPAVRPVNAAARRLLGVRETNQGVLFVQPANSGSTISLAGTFNDWSTTSHQMNRNDEYGVFELCLPLPAGKHYYRLVIDGVWTADPYNNLCEVNQFGEANSVVAVSERTAPMPVSVPMSGPMSAPTAAM